MEVLSRAGVTDEVVKILNKFDTDLIRIFSISGGKYTVRRL